MFLYWNEKWSSEAEMVGGAQRFFRFNKPKKTGERSAAKTL
jgi:hypothetical protein